MDQPKGKGIKPKTALPEEVTRSLQARLSDRRLNAVMRIQAVLLREIDEFMRENQVLEIMPVIAAPITDPLTHGVLDAEIEYYSQRLKLTKSMLYHKQLALVSEERQAIYCVSPNIRLEPAESSEKGRYLIEFSQVDFEIKHATMRDIMDFMERLVVRVFTGIKEECRGELQLLRRKLPIPRRPFKVYDSAEVRKVYGEDFERELSLKETSPFWITNFDREPYDKEDPTHPGSFLNYDLIYPEGYGEGLSGGEREYEYHRIIYRMDRSKVPVAPFTAYLELARMGALPPTAGAGFGVERMLRYICGIRNIADVCLFPKVPGETFYL
ncbi:asparagine synthetase [bacterium (candidate division B38) B3_B38]|nr:MAG: asparagine synthetase [bacterium (candidate division B38) B3_B38]